MFCDQTLLRFIGGKGGNGAVAFRREKFEPKGGPNGGNGGRGGNIYLKVNEGLNSLIDLHSHKKFTARKGDDGMGDNMFGKSGDDLYLDVPRGTIVREVTRNQAGEITKKTEIADLSKKDMIMLAAKGGRGGFGNAHFANSVRQAPKFAELGEDGEEVEVELELKLVADIGIIGVPSAGKSSLIAVVSNARPKIAAYPFTTLIPNLGVVKMGEKESYVVADIPGLIEGAHEGKGLGIEFLKHVQRCRILVHLIDPTQPDWSEEKKSEDISNFQLQAAVNNFELINKELSAFSRDLARKEQIVVINKIDAITPEQEIELRKAIKKSIGQKKRFILYPHAISAATTQGVNELKNFLFRELEKIPKPAWLVQEAEEVHEFSEDSDSGLSEQTDTPRAPSHIIYRPHLENPKYFSVEKIGKKQFRVRGERIEQIFNMTDVANREAVMRARDVLKKMGIDRELKKIGAKDGDMLFVGKRQIDFQSEIGDWW